MPSRFGRFRSKKLTAQLLKEAAQVGGTGQASSSQRLHPRGAVRVSSFSPIGEAGAVVTVSPIGILDVPYIEESKSNRKLKMNNNNKNDRSTGSSEKHQSSSKSDQPSQKDAAKEKAEAPTENVSNATDSSISEERCEPPAFSRRGDIALSLRELLSQYSEFWRDILQGGVKMGLILDKMKEQVPCGEWEAYLHDVFGTDFLFAIGCINLYDAACGPVTNEPGLLEESAAELVLLGLLDAEVEAACKAE